MTYDRLGNGLSDKPDAYKVVQASLQLEILRGISVAARDGSLLKHNNDSTNSNLEGANFRKLIHVGHSFGSILTTGLLTTYGSLSDAAVITGYIPNPHFPEMRKTAFDFAYAPNHKFSDRTSGYLTQGSPRGVQNIFFSTLSHADSQIGGFEPKLLNYAYEIRQTITTSELQAPRVNMGVAGDFKGPVQYVLAEYDFPVCRGDCKLPFDVGMLEDNFPAGKGVEIYTQPGAGHALTMHRGAEGGYKATFAWLGRKGL